MYLTGLHTEVWRSQTRNHTAFFSHNQTANTVFAQSKPL